MTMTCDAKLLVTDVDGCIGMGEGRAYDIGVILHLAEMNRAARRGEPVPAVTLCTGRPAAYVDAMVQVTNGFLPAVFENGAGLYFPNGYRFAWHPSLGHSATLVIAQIRELLQENVVDAGVGYFQPGKEMSLTLLSTLDYTLDDVGRVAEDALSGKGFPCRVDVSVTTVEVRFEGMDKGVGLKWLASETGWSLSNMVAVGDAKGDIAFLSLAGRSAAPANAEREVQAVVDYVSPYEYERGLLDIIDWCQRE